MAWLIIATWNFSLPGIREAGSILQSDGSAFDAVERVGNRVEDDPDVESVGYGGIPNLDGDVELDGAFMDGRTLAIGSVASVRGYGNPISIARRVMTDNPHNVLVGAGAEEFAARCGFRRTILLTDKSISAWNEKIREIRQGAGVPLGHDTVGIVALDTAGRMACGTSTSGLSMKHRGRVGDSPLVGSGFYVDDEVGGAAATGVGEDIMKCCLSFTIVELMRAGYAPREAAEEAILRAHRRLAQANKTIGNMAVVCANRQGQFAGAANHEGFGFAVAGHDAAPAIHAVKPVCVR